MNKNKFENIIGVVVGIRFNRSFRIPDISGDIIDHVLCNSKSPFSTDFFPRIQENSSREKTLFNTKSSEYLRINTDDVILGIKTENNFANRFDWVKDVVLPYFKNELFKTYEIKNIRRLGVIFLHKIVKNQKLTETILSITNGKISDADNISISFSKKILVEEALFRKGVEDYKNHIYNFQEFKDAVYVDLDCQYYYKPAIEDLRECFTEKILEESKRFLENNFYEWLNRYEDKKDR